MKPRKSYRAPIPPRKKPLAKLRENPAKFVKLLVGLYVKSHDQLKGAVRE